MKKSQKKALAVGAGVAALAAAAAGTYLLTGKRGAKTKTVVKKWLNTAEKEIQKQAKKAEKLSKAGYEKIVDQVMKQYKQVKSVDQSELLAAAKQLKQDWDSFSGSVEKTVKSTAKQLGKKTAVKKPVSKKKSSKK